MLSLRCSEKIQPKHPVFKTIPVSILDKIWRKAVSEKGSQKTLLAQTLNHSQQINLEPSHYSQLLRSSVTVTTGKVHSGIAGGKPPGQGEYQSMVGKTGFAVHLPSEFAFPMDWEDVVFFKKFA